MMSKFKSGTSLDALLLTIVKLITTVLGLLVIRIISEYFSYSDYGTYNQAIIIASTVSTITILGFVDATNYYFNKYTSQLSIQTQYLSTIIVFQILIGTLAFIVLISSRNILANTMDNKSLAAVVKWIALTPLLNNIIAIQQIIYISLGKSKVIALRNLIISIAKLITVLVSVYFTKSIITILAAVLLFDILQMIYFAFSLSRYGVVVSFKMFSLGKLKNVFSYSIPLTIFIATNALMRDTDKYIISCFEDIETFAIYSNASRILPFTLVVDSFTTVLLPIVTKYLHDYKLEKLTDVYKNYLNFSFIIVWILVTGAIICSTDFMTLLYGTKYIVGLPIFICYLLVSLVKFANFSFIFSCAGRTKIILKISVISLLLNVVLSVFLFYLMGPIGCAIATLVVSIIIVVYYLYETTAIISVSPFKLIELRSFFRLIAQSLLLCVLVLIGQKLLIDIHHLIRLILTYGIYVAVLLFINRATIKRYLIALNNN